MFKALKALFNREVIDFKELKNAGAEIIDVRTPGEFRTGNIKGSKNIPLAEIPHKLSSLKDKNKTYITCCASGMRSSSARAIMKKNGYVNVHNGGGWSSLQSKLN